MGARQAQDARTVAGEETDQRRAQLVVPAPRRPDGHDHGGGAKGTLQKVSAEPRLVDRRIYQLSEALICEGAQNVRSGRDAATAVKRNQKHIVNTHAHASCVCTLEPFRYLPLPTICIAHVFNDLSVRHRHRVDYVYV